MKKIISLITMTLFSILSFGQIGTLDSTFNSTGIRISDLGSTDDKLAQMLVQPDQKVLAIGYDNINKNIVISRYKTDGSYDSTMGTNGLAIGPSFEPLTAALQADGKIIVGGFTGSNSQGITLSRHHTNGTIDSTFGTNGLVVARISVGLDICKDVKIQTDGKIVVFAEIDNGSISTNVGILRFLPTGVPDSTFGLNGAIEVVNAIGTDDEAVAGAIQPDGKILVVGSVSKSDVFAMRFHVDGRPDSSFGTNGLVVTDVSSNRADIAYNMRLTVNGRIVVVGRHHSSAGIRCFILRYQSNGTIDNSFGAGGRLLYSPLTVMNGAMATDIELQSDQKIVVISEVTNLSQPPFGPDFYVSRFSATGLLDTSFGTQGHTLTKMMGANSGGTPSRVRIQNDGKILVAGVAGITASNNNDIGIARYLSSRLNVSTRDLKLSTVEALVYPSPISSNAYLNLTVRTEQSLSLHLYDISGMYIKEVFNDKKFAKGKHKHTIPMDGLSAGNYILILSSKEKKLTIKLQKR